MITGCSKGCGLAVAALADLCRAVAVAAKKREGRHSLVIAAGVHQRKGIAVHGSEVIRVILIGLRQIRIQGQDGGQLARLIGLVRLCLLNAVLAVGIAVQFEEGGDGGVILPGLQGIHGAAVLLPGQHDLRHHQERGDAHRRHGCQQDGDFAGFRSPGFCFTAGDFVLLPLQLRLDALPLLALGFLPGAAFGVLPGLQGVGLRDFRLTLGFQLVALHGGSLAVPVAAQGAEGCCGLPVLLLRHEGVGPVIGGGAEGFQLFVAPAEALGSVRIIAQRGDAGLHPFDSLHRAGTIKQRHGGGILGGLLPLPVALDDGLVPARQLRLQRLVGEAQGLLVMAVGRKGPGLPGQVGLAAHMQLGHQLAQIGAGVLEVQVQRLLAELVRLAPLAVLQSHERPPQQGLHVGRCAIALHHHGGRGLRGLRPGQFADAVDQILHEAQLAHVLGLQVTEFLRQVVGIHVPVGRDEGLVRPGADQRKEAAPLVLHPHGVEVLRLGAQHHHDLCAVQRGEDVRLVLLAQLVLQGDAAEEYLEALPGQLVVQVVGQHAVGGALTLGVRLLVADEHIEGLFLPGDGQDALLDAVDHPGLFLIDGPLHAVGVLQGGLVVVIGEDGGILRPVDGGHAPARGRILHVLDAVAAQHQRPVGLRIGAVILQNLLEDAHGLVVLVVAAEVVGAVVQVQPAVAVQLRDGLHGAAELARAGGGVGCRVQIAAAHFALDDHEGVSSCLSMGPGLICCPSPAPCAAPSGRRPCGCFPRPHSCSGFPASGQCPRRWGWAWDRHSGCPRPACAGQGCPLLRQCPPHGRGWPSTGR